jgi:superfamily I DNA/RNA helicase
MSTPEEQEEGRRNCLQQILDSTARRKLIVAGPGTGKTHTFKALLERTGGPNLALTFINALAADLGDKLGDLAETHTFHGYCRRMLHTHAVGGVSMSVDYFPNLLAIQADDLTRLSGVAVSGRDIEHEFHYLDQTSGLIDRVLRSGEYYDAIGHLDSVYRMLRYFESNPGSIPKYRQVVVDEYQDFSLLEVSFIEMVTQHSPSLIVGDDDQALYGFKHASADYIRNLATNPDYERFPLPYCSRCTQVLVTASHTVVANAQSIGRLNGRIDKQYECFLPTKQTDSALYPKIIHANCSVERNATPYMGRYILGQIEEISADDIAESRLENYPTVLVVGPTQFANRIYEYLASRLSDVQFKRSTQAEVSPVDAYMRLIADPSSRLGWRILLHLYPTANVNDILNQALIIGEELEALLPEDFRQKHLASVALLQRFRNDEDLSLSELASLETAVETSPQKLRDILGISDEQTTEDLAVDRSKPSVVVTSLVGAKGLQACHVFVVGMNEGHFPHSNIAITDDEVCSLLVALTRATKSCTLVSCNRFGSEQVRPSVFLTWLAPYLSPLYVDKTYWSEVEPES